MVTLESKFKLKLNRSFFNLPFIMNSSQRLKQHVIFPNPSIVWWVYLAYLDAFTMNEVLDTHNLNIDAAIRKWVIPQRLELPT